MSNPEVVASCEFAKCVVEALLLATGEEVHEKLTRLDKGQPGSVLRALRLTRNRLTGEHGSEIMLKGPTAKGLTVRVNELVGNVGLVGASVFDLSEEDREHASRAPLPQSRPLRDELVSASQTLVRHLGEAVVLRNRREASEAELASLVETADFTANVIRDQRKGEIEGEIARVTDLETELLGDVYEVSNGVRQSLEKRMHLLSNLIRLGLGPIPTPKAVQMYTAEKLGTLSIEKLAEAWHNFTPEERAYMMNNHYDELRNLPGIPYVDREEMQKNYIMNVYKHGPQEDKDWLLAMGFLKEGPPPQAGRRFVKLNIKERKYITVHGCETYEHIQVNLEGTGTQPGNPEGLGNLDKLDRKADWIKEQGGCFTYLLFRDATFNQWTNNSPWTGTDFSDTDVESFKAELYGMQHSNDGSEFRDVRMHSAGAGMAPDLHGTPVHRIILDDGAIVKKTFPEGWDIPITVFLQESITSFFPKSNLPESVHEIRVRPSSERNLEENIAFLDTAPNPELRPLAPNPNLTGFNLETLKNVTAAPSHYVENWVVNAVQGLVAGLGLASFAELKINQAIRGYLIFLMVSNHSNGWEDETQWRYELIDISRL